MIEKQHCTLAPHQMRRVIVESPYAGDVEANLTYARAACLACLKRGESPYASHLILTQVGILDDLVGIERALGLNAGQAWQFGAHALVVYQDRGISEGMKAAINSAESKGLPIEYRNLP